MNATTTVRSIVPAFFVIRAAAEDADSIAADMAAEFNNGRADDEEGHADAPRTRLYLCEASPTTEELDEEDEDPHTLEGYTCDSGSDRSAAGLIRTIAEACEECPVPEASAAIAVVSHVGQLAHDWLRQRMALGHSEPEPAHPTEREDAIDLLLHAFARAEVNGHQAALNVREAFERARIERPGAYEAILAMHQQYAAEAAQAVDRG